MTLPSTDTTVTYPDGATTSTGPVLHVEPLTDGWIFVVAHIVDGVPPAIGESAYISVDEEYRSALSAAHTACHLAALALDTALATAWSKTAPTDALGNPAVDCLAIQHSRIGPNYSTDTYRIGKSLRRKGFTSAALDDLPTITDRVNTQLVDWIRSGGTVHIERDDTAFSARRGWTCELPEGRTNIPCGGTHLHDLAQLSLVRTAFMTTGTDGALELTMETTISETPR